MITRIAVVVPAADEQDTIAQCLVALREASRNAPCEVRLVVVLDSCSDATADIVAAYAEVETLDVACRNVGRARALGASAAVLADPDPATLLIASTDADSVVRPDWLQRLCTLAVDGVDLVVGTVVPDEALAEPLVRAWFADHSLREGHPHVHGANLAIRGSAYLSLGGWLPLATGEDVDLVARAVDAGLGIVRTPSIPVRTSTRATGRAPHGFSSYLRALGHA